MLSKHPSGGVVEEAEPLVGEAGWEAQHAPQLLCAAGF